MEKWDLPSYDLNMYERVLISSLAIFFGDFTVCFGIDGIISSMVYS